MNTTLESEHALEEVCHRLENGTPLDPSLLRKIEAEAEAIRNEIREKHGEIEVAVELIREARTRP